MPDPAAAANATSVVSPWMAPIFTLLGAAIGAAGSTLTAAFTSDRGHQEKVWDYRTTGYSMIIAGLQKAHEVCGYIVLGCKTEGASHLNSDAFKMNQNIVWENIQKAQDAYANRLLLCSSEFSDRFQVFTKKIARPDAYEMDQGDRYKEALQLLEVAKSELTAIGKKEIDDRHGIKTTTGIFRIFIRGTSR